MDMKFFGVVGREHGSHGWMDENIFFIPVTIRSSNWLNKMTFFNVLTWRQSNKAEGSRKLGVEQA